MYDNFVIQFFNAWITPSLKFRQSSIPLRDQLFVGQQGCPVGRMQPGSGISQNMEVSPIGLQNCNPRVMLASFSPF